MGCSPHGRFHESSQLLRQFMSLEWEDGAKRRGSVSCLAKKKHSLDIPSRW